MWSTRKLMDLDITGADVVKNNKKSKTGSSYQNVAAGLFGNSFIRLWSKQLQMMENHGAV